MKNHLARIAFATAFIPALAFAHAELLKSEPANDGTLAASAKEITLTFEEAVKPANCKLTAEGKDVPGLGKPRADGVTLHVPLAKPLEAGAYALTCRVVGPDSHPVNNTIKFTATK